jgi:hypothetical protein
MNLDQLLDAFDEVEGAAAEDVLAGLREAHDRGEWRSDLPPIGDFYVALSEEADDDGDVDVAVRVRAQAVGLPASDPQWIVGTHLADGYTSDRRRQLNRLQDAAQRLDGPQRARLLAAFAEAIGSDDPHTATRLLEDALPLAIAARDDGDDTTYGNVIVPRALLRASQRLDRDVHDDAADTLLGAIDESERGATVAHAPPPRSFVAMPDLALAAQHWPTHFPSGTDAATVSAFYGQLEARFRTHHAEFHQAFALQPLSVSLAVTHGVDLSSDPVDAPDAFWTALARAEPPSSWPPARNDACWCRSGRKYKRCCGGT